MLMLLGNFLAVFFFGIIFAAMGDLINMSIQFSIIYTGSIIAMYLYAIIDKTIDDNDDLFTKSK